MISKYKKSGWHNESARHSLAAKGVKTKSYEYFYNPKGDVPAGGISGDVRAISMSEAQKIIGKQYGVSPRKVAIVNYSKAVITVDKFNALTEKQKQDYLKKLDSHQLWDLVLKVGRRSEPVRPGMMGGDPRNTLDQDDINSILGLEEFFGATDIWMRQTAYDLGGPAKFRVFDWLGMSIMGRNDDDRAQNSEALRVLTWSYLKSNGNVKKFIEDIRVTDYDINKGYEAVPDLKVHYAKKDWKKTVNQDDYKVWQNKNKNKSIAVYRNALSTPSGRTYILDNKSTAMERAERYMKKN